MEFGIEIGQNEKHHLTVQRNWFTGRMTVSIDATPVFTKSPYSPSTHISFIQTHKYEFSIGKIEKHVIRVERARPHLFAGFRSHIYRVFVDDCLIKEIRGY